MVEVFQVVWRRKLCNKFAISKGKIPFLGMRRENSVILAKWWILITFSTYLKEVADTAIAGID